MAAVVPVDEDDAALLLVSEGDVGAAVELLGAALIDCPARSAGVREELLDVGAAEGTLEAVVALVGPALSVSAAAVTPDPLSVYTRRGSGT